MGEQGIVSRITGRVVEVTLQPSDACKKCPACHFCRPSGTKRIISAANPGDIKIGDEVNVHMIARNSLLAIFLFFGLPVVLSLIGLLIGQHYGEICSLGIGTGGFVIGLIIAKVVNDILSTRHGFFPRITKVTRKTQS